MTADAVFVLGGVVAFGVACGIHYAGYRRFIGGALSDPEPQVRRAALIRWARFAVGWQLLVLALCAGWIAPFLLRHQHGFAWMAPAIGLLVGTAAPLQLVALAVSRSARPGAPPSAR